MQMTRLGVFFFFVSFFVLLCCYIFDIGEFIQGTPSTGILMHIIFFSAECTVRLNQGTSGSFLAKFKRTHHRLEFGGEDPLKSVWLPAILHLLK